MSDSEDVIKREKMSLTRALSEVKILEKRINKKIQEFEPITLTQGKKPPIGFESVQQFIQNKKSEYQSILDLIDRRSQIKRKIVLANATNEVTIDDKKMTIAEAIDYKNSVIKFKENLKEKIIYDFSNYSGAYESQMEKVNDMIDQQLVSLFGKEKKVSQEEIDNIRKPYLEHNGPKFIDSIGAKEKYDNLSKEIDEFLLKVDHILSEANATTFIEINR